MLSVYPITVLYYDDKEPSSLKKHLFKQLEIGKDRVLIPDDFRKGRTIVAVIKGEISILNTMRERSPQ